MTTQPQTAQLTLKRNGALTDLVFPFSSPAIVGRFDPSVGPIDVDLGSQPEGSYVSRKHAKLECDEEGIWSVADLGSSNGTFLLRDDFEKVEWAELSDGCEIAFGNARFLFNTAVAGEEAPAETPEATAEDVAEPETTSDVSS